MFHTNAVTHRYATGVVIRSTGSWIDVQVTGRVVRTRVRGRFRLRGWAETNPVAVGDRVTVRLNGDDTGLITDVDDRRNQLSRRAAGKRIGQEHVLVANVDAVWIVQSVRLPRLNPGFIDRVLVAAEAQDLMVGIVINKTDLADDADTEWLALVGGLYRSLGYTVYFTSALTGDGIDMFRSELVGATSVLTGPSGVGKSRLLNAVEPGLDLRVGAVSDKTRKGRHTTAHASLRVLSEGGFVIDTPGIREFGVLNLEPWELSHYFPEFRTPLRSCRFPACTHDHEPQCAVKEAYLEGSISEDRYSSYLNILHSINLGDADVGR